MSVPELEQILADAKDKLWEYRREVRPRPHRDDKIITSWNGNTHQNSI